MVSDWPNHLNFLKELHVRTIFLNVLMFRQHLENLSIAKTSLIFYIQWDLVALAAVQL